MIEAMLRAPADSTARDVLHGNAARIRYVAVNDANVVLNINNPDEYNSLAPSSGEK
jgi:CTP:molybdopterin cytidylyltransferase MocA